MGGSLCRCWWLLAVALLCACAPAETERWVAVTVSGLPGSAAALELQLILGQTPASTTPRFDGLALQAARGDASVLLRLPLEASGPLLLAAGARDAAGCLLSTGTASAGLTRGVPLVEARVSLAALPGRDTACRGGPTISDVSVPSLEALAPLPSGGGAELTVRGFGFHPLARLTIGGAPAEALRWRSPLELSAVAPALPGRAGPLEIAVSNPDGGAHARADLLRGYLGTLQFDAPVQRPLGPGLPLQHAPYPALLADVDGDKRADLVTYFIDESKAHFLSVSRSTGDAAAPFAPAARFALPGTARTVSGVTRLAMADLDGDGKMDIVVGTSLDPPLVAETRVLLNRGDGTFPTDGGVLVGGGGIAGAMDGVTAGDLNGDGRPDLVISAGSAARYVVYLNQGGGSFAFAANVPVNGAGSQPLTARVADFDGDGIADLAVVRNTPDVLITFGAGGGRLPAQQVAQGLEFIALGLEAGDVDDDGRIDLLCFEAVGGIPARRIAFLRNLGRGSFAPAEIYTLPGTWLDVSSIGDLDGDGLLDLATAYSLAGQARTDVARRLPGGGFQSVGIFEGVAGNSKPLVFDADGDGKPDVIGLSGTASSTALSVLRSTAR